MKTRLLALALAALLLLTAGCSSGNLSLSKEEPRAGYDNSGSLTDTEEQYYNRPDQNSDEIVPDVRKIIKNGKLDLEAEDVDKAYATLLAYATQNGGYEFSHQKTVRDDYVSIEAVIKIKPDKLDDMMAYAGNLAKIINSSTTSDDITDKYYDAQTRLQTKRKTLERYYALLEEAKTISDILAIQSDIDKLTEEIEAFEGKLKMWDQLVSESSLTITIHQLNDPLKPKKAINWSALSWEDMGQIIQNGFMTVINVVVAVLQWTVIALAAASPLLVIAGIVVVIIVVIRKRKKGRQQIPPQNPPQPPQPPQNPTNTPQG